MTAAATVFIFVITSLVASFNPPRARLGVAWRREARVVAMERPSSEATARELPDELVDRIAALRCSAGGLREWCASWRGVSRRFADLRWFEEHARGGSPVAVVPSPEYPSVQLGISRAPPATETASRRPKDDADVLRDEPIVLVRPGTHAENVRVTRTCAVLGWGARDDVVDVHEREDRASRDVRARVSTRSAVAGAHFADPRRARVPVPSSCRRTGDGKPRTTRGRASRDVGRRADECVRVTHHL